MKLIMSTTVRLSVVIVVCFNQSSFSFRITTKVLDTATVVVTQPIFTLKLPRVAHALVLPVQMQRTRAHLLDFAATSFISSFFLCIFRVFSVVAVSLGTYFPLLTAIG